MFESVASFGDELEKIGFFNELWTRIRKAFSNEDEKTKQRVDYFFSPKAGPDKWDKFSLNVGSQAFVDQLASHPGADPTLVQHAQALHNLAKGKTVGKIYSSTLPGKSYEIKETAQGTACTCPDWRFVGTLTPGYKCKHIKAHEAGLARAE